MCIGRDTVVSFCVSPQAGRSEAITSLEHALLGGQYIINQLLEVFLPTTPKHTSIWKAVETRRKQLVEAEGSERDAVDDAEEEAPLLGSQQRAAAPPPSRCAAHVCYSDNI